MKNIKNIDKYWPIIRFIILFTGFVLIPSYLYSLFIKLNLSENEMLLQVIANLIFMIILIIVFFKMLKKDIIDFKNNFSNYLEKGLKYWGIGLLIMIISNLIINIIIMPGISENEELNRTYLLTYPLFGFISAVIIAPVVEELTFRYSLKDITKNSILYSLICGIIFGLLHALTLITTPLQLLYIIPYGALGFTFAYLYSKTKNIIVPITMHMIHNFVTYILIIVFLR